jgi:hypothetical protein
VNDIYYANALNIHSRKGNNKKPPFRTKRWFLLREGGRLHITHATTEALADICGTPVEHPPNNPDFASSDFWAFPTLKHELRGQKFSTDAKSKSHRPFSRKYVLKWCATRV